MAMSAAAAAAARRAALAQLRSLSPSAQTGPASGKLTGRWPHSLQARRYCKTPPAGDKTEQPSGDKIDQILQLLKNRSLSEVEAKTVQERLARLEAKVYWGGILFGVVAGVSLGFPLMGHDLKTSVESIKGTQERTDKVVTIIDDRLKALELGHQKDLKADNAVGTPGSEAADNPETTGNSKEEANPSPLFKVLAYLKVV